MCNCLDPLDRYGRTPLDDAKEFGHIACVEILQRALEKYIMKTQEKNNSATSKS